MKNDNDKKIFEYKKKKFEKYFLVILSFLVIILEILALFNIINMMWGLGLFVLMYILKKIFLK